MRPRLRTETSCIDATARPRAIAGSASGRGAWRAEAAAESRGPARTGTARDYCTVWKSVVLETPTLDKAE